MSVAMTVAGIRERADIERRTPNLRMIPPLPRNVVADNRWAEKEAGILHGFAE
jgi:hypothetical protein